MSKINDDAVLILCGLEAIEPDPKMGLVILAEALASLLAGFARSDAPTLTRATEAITAHVEQSAIRYFKELHPCAQS